MLVQFLDDFYGENCEHMKPCSQKPSPCGTNSKSCTDFDDFSGFSCECKEGWTGSLCDVAIPCYSIPCQNNASCSDVGNYTDYTLVENTEWIKQGDQNIT